MPILRVFPRKTNATPQDDYTAIGSPGLFIPDDISEIHISVTFTWDLQYAEILADQWSRYGNVKIGGPATGMRGEILLRACTSNTATLSLLAAVIITAGSALFLNVKALYASFPLLMAGIYSIIISSLVRSNI